MLKSTCLSLARLISVLAMAFVLYGCGKDDTAEVAPAAKAPVAEAPVAEAPVAEAPVAEA